MRKALKGTWFWRSLLRTGTIPFVLDWMLRTWWVQGIVGVLFALGLTNTGPLPWEPVQWVGVAINLSCAGWFFFGAGALWADRKRVEQGESLSVRRQ